MYKDTMDGATIMFIGDTYCKAYNITYLNENYNFINSNLQSVRKIYYKCNDSRNSWINYKRALTKPENKSLSYVERILLAIKNDFLSDEEFNSIPECEYTDYAGYTYTIGARDGLDSVCTVKQLANILETNIQKTMSFDTKEKCKKLVVDFKTNIENALITFNGLFEPYVIQASALGVKTAATFYEKDGLEFPKDADGNYRTEWCHITPYVWDDILIEDNDEHPYKRDDKWVVFKEEIDESCMVIYNKTFYEYDINKYDPHYLTITGIDIGNSNNFELTDIKVIRFKSKTGEKVKQQRITGFYNETDHTVYFPYSINNSIIVYNGVNHSYIVKPDGKSIKFRIPGDIILDEITGVDENSTIMAINLYTGELPTTVAKYPQTDLAQSANQMLGIYKNKLDKANARVSELEKRQDLIYDDYRQHVLMLDSTSQAREGQFIRLDYIPDESSIRLVINHMEYEKDLYFNFDRESNSIEWTFTEYNNGFDLNSKMDIDVIYDFYYKANGIDNPENFKNSMNSDTTNK